MTTTDLLPTPVVLGNTLPRHIAFIADGNRRWAKAHGTTVEEGYRQGAAAVHRALAHCRALGVEAVSVFLMSDRNFDRAPAEVAVLVDVIADIVDTETAASTGPVRILSSGPTMSLRPPSSSWRPSRAPSGRPLTAPARPSASASATTGTTTSGAPSTRPQPPPTGTAQCVCRSTST